MSSGLVIGSHRSIAATLADELRPRLRGDDRIEIIVSTRSAAAALLSRLSDALPTTKLTVHSIETLATRILNDAGRYPRLASEQERELAMELAARSVDTRLAATPGITSMLLRSVRDVRDSGIALSDLRYRIGGATRLTVRDRLGTVARIWSTAAQLLRDSGATEMPDLLSDAIELVRSGASVPRQIVFGYYDVTGLQRALLDALADQNRIESIFVPVQALPDGTLPESSRFAAPFTEWARKTCTEIHVLDSHASAPQWTIAAHPSPLREMHEACRAVRSLLDEGVAANEIAIVTRAIEPPVAVLIGTLARRFGFGLRGLPGRRLSGNRIARGVIDLLHLQQRNFLRRDVMDIIRSGARLPETKGTLPSLDRIESATRRALVARGGRALILAAEKRSRYRPEDEPDDTLLHYADLVDALDRRTSGFGGNRTGTAWSHSIDELVGLFRVETEEDLDAIDALHGIARALRRGGFATKRFDARTVTRLIEEAGPLASPSPDEPAVWFGDVMRFRGVSVRHLFAIRMQHDAFPQRRIEDALLPDVDRRALGVREVGDGRDEESLLFSLLTSSATDAIHFSYASSDSIGRTLRPSSFVKDFVIAHRPDDRLPILQDLRAWLSTAPKPPSDAQSRRETTCHAMLDEPSPPLVRALQFQASKGTGSPFDGIVTPDDALHARLTEVFRRTSASRLEHLGECPQRFFVSSVLRFREVEDPEPNVQIEIRQKGQVDHSILEELYSGLTDDDWRTIESGDDVSLLAALNQRLATVVSKQFRKLEEEFPPLNATIREIERDETAVLLSRFAASDLGELATSGFRPAEFELLLDVEDTGAAKLAMGPIDAGIQGRIDRIDRHPDGRVRVIDYKAGKAFRQTKLEARIDEGLRLQLPVYALVVRRLWNLDPSAVSASLRPLRVDASEAEGYGFDLDERYEHLTGMLDTLADAIWKGRFPAVPYQDVCNYCLIKAWCRTRNDPREAVRATRHGSAVRFLEAEES